MHSTKTSPPAPARAGGFADLGLHEHLMRALDRLEFTTPTAVQAEAIPAASAGRDVLACASTGSGKTAAFLLPLLEQLRETPRGETRALVLVPTRELAAQVMAHFRELAHHTQLRAAAVYGGVGMKPQEQAFRRGVDVIVATPGRLLDHMQYGYAHLSGVRHLVLDEADRMLDMGFLPALRQVLAHLPRERQTLLFSATMPPRIAELARELLADPVLVNHGRSAKPAAGITQAFYPVRSARKVDLLVELLRRDEIGNAIVFCRTKHRANRVAAKLERAGIGCERIHGNRSQAQRTKALAGFKDGTYRVLVATDIVARGIDVTALEHVVNFDVPNGSEDYIHRVGRTARADAVGDAYTFVAPEEESTIRDIERALNKRIERRIVDGFDYSSNAADEPLEIPLQERLAAMRQARAGARRRSGGAPEKTRSQSGSRQGTGTRANGTARGSETRENGTARGNGKRDGTPSIARAGGENDGRRRRRSRRPRGNAA
ncbi:MAG TPA: DEAD/DEAH box helicase [Longimicrobiales bacterium]|nr:DEAD/DEAH box helicase [Longimicrobiales bacterium]